MDCYFSNGGVGAEVPGDGALRDLMPDYLAHVDSFAWQDNDTLKWLAGQRQASIIGRVTLEGAIETFPGSMMIISHDRWFLDRLATHILAFEGDSHVEFFPGNYSEYEEDRLKRLGTKEVVPTRLKYKKLA